MKTTNRLTSAFLIAAVLGVSAGCASSAPGPTHCNRSDRHGSYLVSFANVSGNCPTPPQTLINMDEPSTCTPVTVRWSQNDCRLETTSYCGGTHITGLTTQENQDGSHLDGTLSVQDSSCLGTFHIDYQRQ